MVLTIGLGSTASELTDPADDPVTATNEIRTLLEANCYACHGPATQTAGVDFESLIAAQPLVKNRETWARVRGALSVGKMPPPEAPQPPPHDRTRLIELLDTEVFAFDYSTLPPDPGFERMRRLTHRQFDFTIRDLFGIEIEVTDRFPGELTGATGFDNSSNTLFLQPALMERYIAASQRIVEILFPLERTTADHDRAYRSLFIAKPNATTTARSAAAEVLDRFLLRAYRRPPSPRERQTALELFASAFQRTESFEAGIKHVVQAVLISPKFLMRYERAPERSEPFRIDAWELASRVSYFLFSSMPDEELFQLAESGRLLDEGVLDGQIERMLADPKADTLGDVFAAQWLGFEHVGTRIRLDPIDFPWCTDSLMDAMRAETSLFFLSLVRGNHPIERLLDADYTFMNEELATTLYGRDDVAGAAMRRVTLTDPHRGGLLSQPSILALTSNYSETSPVKRGTYVLDTILGTPPPEPPPNAAVLSDEVAEMENMSFREKLEMHSRHEFCRGCHSRIDPIGFSLENFDFFGRWREAYAFRERVDTAEEADETIEFETETSPEPIVIHLKNIERPIMNEGALPDGGSFVGPAGLTQAILSERRDALVRQVVTKLYAYALGRQLEYYDEPAIRQTMREIEASGYRFGPLIRSIARSFPFQYKQNPEPAP